jgi:YVTN family beta-propeller protein
MARIFLLWVLAAAATAGAAQAACVLYVAEVPNSVVEVIDCGADKRIGELPAGSFPVALRLDGTSGRLFSANWGTGAGSVSFIDVSAGTVLHEAPVFSGPLQMAVDAKGIKVYVPSTGAANVADSEIAVLDAQNGDLIASRKLGADLAVAVLGSDQTTLFALDLQGTVFKVDTSTLEVLAEWSIGGMPVAAEIIGRDRNTLAVVDAANARLLLLSTQTGAQVGNVPVGAYPSAIVAAEPLREQLFVSNRDSDTISVIETRSRRRVVTLPGGDAPIDLELSADQKYLYVASQSAPVLSKVSISAGKIVKTLPLAGFPTSLAAGTSHPACRPGGKGRCPS